MLRGEWVGSDMVTLSGQPLAKRKWRAGRNDIVTDACNEVSRGVIVLCETETRYLVCIASRRTGQLKRELEKTGSWRRKRRILKWQYCLFMFCWTCVSIHPCNENQLDALFILSLFRQSSSACFGHICSPSSGGILNRIEQNGMWVRAFPGPVDLRLILTGPVCPVFYTKLKEPCCKGPRVLYQIKRALLQRAPCSIPN